jgi:hypothetical protein
MYKRWTLCQLTTLGDKFIFFDGTIGCILLSMGRIVGSCDSFRVSFGEAGRVFHENEINLL